MKLMQIATRTSSAHGNTANHQLPVDERQVGLAHEVAERRLTGTGLRAEPEEAAASPRRRRRATTDV